MALSVLDGNQSATTLSSVVTGGEHIVAHSVVSLGSNAISNITTAISGSTVCVGNLGLLQSTVATEGLSASGSFIKIGGHTGTSTTGNIVHVSAVGALRVDGSVYTQPVSIASVTIGNTVTIAGTVTANPTGTQTIAGTVTAMAGTNFSDEIYQGILEYANNEGGDGSVPLQVNIGSLPAISGTVTASISNSLTIGSLPAISGTVTANTVYATNVTGNAGLVASTVTAIPVALVDRGVYGGSIMSYDGSNTSLNINVKGSLPSLVAGTAQIGSVTASISNSVVTFYPMQGTTVTNSNFTSTTASTTLVSAVAGRECLTVFNEGAGNLHISPGATCTTISYQVRLSAGDYWECPQGQLSLAHTAVFATSGTARVTEVS